MAERDRAKRALMLRFGLYLGLPLAGLVIGWALQGFLWGLAGLLVGAVVATGVGALLRPAR